MARHGLRPSFLGAPQKAGHLVERATGRRQPDALHRCPGERLEPLEREHQVAAALRGHQRVNLVDDDGLHVAQRLARAGSEHQVQRLWRRDENVGRVPDQPSALFGRRVTTAHPHDGRSDAEPEPRGRVGDADERGPQVAFDVDSERLERRDVEHARPGLAGRASKHQRVDGMKERRQRLAAPRRREQQGRVALVQQRPGLLLRLGRFGEDRGEPLAGRLMEEVEGGHARLL